MVSHLVRRVVVLSLVVVVAVSAAGSEWPRRVPPEGERPIAKVVWVMKQVLRMLGDDLITPRP
jgi:hypothetical protein